MCLHLLAWCNSFFLYQARWHSVSNPTEPHKQNSDIRQVMQALWVSFASTQLKWHTFGGYLSHWCTCKTPIWPHKLKPKLCPLHWCDMTITLQFTHSVCFWSFCHHLHETDKMKTPEAKERCHKSVSPHSSATRSNLWNKIMIEKLWAVLEPPTYLIHLWEMYWNSFVLSRYLEDKQEADAFDIPYQDSKAWQHKKKYGNGNSLRLRE